MRRWILAVALLWGCDPVCGDGAVDPGEECDDANQDDTDACTTACKGPICGDGFTQASLFEECDDGNDATDDGCFLCQFREICDNAIDGVEIDDDGDGLVNCDDTDVCAADPICTFNGCDHDLSFTFDGTPLDLSSGGGFGGEPTFLGSCQTVDFKGAQLCLDITSTVSGNVTANLAPSPQDMSLLLFDVCSVIVGNEIGCAEESGAGGAEALPFALVAGETVSLCIGLQEANTLGPFTLTLNPS